MGKLIRTQILIALVGCLCLASVQAQQAQQQSTALAPDLIKRIDALVEAEREKQRIPGLSLAIASGNQIVYTKGYGTADLEHGVAARPETVYRTASIAKAMTAVAVMQLADAGRIDLDAPIQKYCPAFPEKDHPVTARQLLGHLGGIRHYRTSAEASGTRHYTSIVESLTIFREEPLIAEPGTKFNYTTYGYTILGCAIEGATRKSYDDYMRENVWAKAGMSATGIDNIRFVIPNRARGYQRLSAEGYQQLPEVERKVAKVGEIYNAALHDTSMKIPGGGLVSTAVDLVRFAIAINTGVIASERSRALMWEPQKTKGGESTGYGLGWAISGEGERKLVSHSGGQAGTSTLLTMMPSKGVAVAVMSNLQGASLGEMVNQIGRLFAPPAQPAASSGR